jgi:hypothetical protein
MKSKLDGGIMEKEYFVLEKIAVNCTANME